MDIFKDKMIALFDKKLVDATTMKKIKTVKKTT